MTTRSELLKLAKEASVKNSDLSRMVQNYEIEAQTILNKVSQLEYAIKMTAMGVTEENMSATLDNSNTVLVAHQLACAQSNAFNILMHIAAYLQTLDYEIDW